VLNPLQQAEIEEILRRALANEERGLGATPVEIPDEVLRQLSLYANGDARIALNILELAISLVQGQGSRKPAVSHNRRS